LNVFFVIAALKVNIVYLLIFVSAGLGFTLIAAAFWALAEGAVAAGTSLTVVSTYLVPSRIVFLKRRLTVLNRAAELLGS
jgi:hypothetical protein